MKLKQMAFFTVAAAILSTASKTFSKNVELGIDYYFAGEKKSRMHHEFTIDDNDTIGEVVNEILSRTKRRLNSIEDYNNKESQLPEFYEVTRITVTDNEHQERSGTIGIVDEIDLLDPSIQNNSFKSLSLNFEKDDPRNSLYSGFARINLYLAKTS